LRRSLQAKWPENRRKTAGGRCRFFTNCLVV